ncbi:MAG: tRNA preQ1(34) S-adenosylmethionine ribosyltransferase-isomerase QueA [Chloroflexi bacterium]|nr:tRNA preQ1(34) S-adenosylmethionine ribosyltransferase-isomerase QueA [Chloroflexota bacterium]
MKTSDFDYYLPPDRIAQTPVEPRHASRLMVLHRQSQTIERRFFSDIADYLRPGDVLVCNESRVIPARLYGRKDRTGGQVEVLLIAKRGENIWEALVKPGRRVRPGVTLVFTPSDSGQPRAVEPLTGEVLEQTEGGGRLIRFSGVSDVEAALDALGTVPLPPYIHTPVLDIERYQTVYARVKGSVAAPTAGLHFTPRLITQLQKKGITFVFVTLHIGLDTFRPVREEELSQHRMHAEFCQVALEATREINRARERGGRIVAVGTTAARVLETAVDKGGIIQPFTGWTDIFIYPGYSFKAIDALLTNFHLPRSTLLMLVSAFAGKGFIDRAYAEAIAKGYRFYSFGDAMLIL